MSNILREDLIKQQSLNTLYIGDCLNILPTLTPKTIDIVYLDPPYNTKNTNFGYSDNNKNWIDFMHQVLSNIYPLMKTTGVIFISIDDNQYHYLKVLLDSIFGQSNYLGSFITRQATRSNSKHINTSHEYILSYAKQRNKCPEFKMSKLNPIHPHSSTINKLMKEVQQFKPDNIKSLSNDCLTAINLANKYLKERIQSLLTQGEYEWNWIKNYNQIDENFEIYATGDLSVPATKSNYPQPLQINCSDIGLFIDCPKLNRRAWQSKETIIQLYLNNELVFKNGRPYRKRYLKDSIDSAMSVLNFYSRQGFHDLENEIGKAAELFATPKPVELISYLLGLTAHYYHHLNIKPNVLDCFGGSGTTAIAYHKIYGNNNANGGWTLIQNEEPCVKNFVLDLSHSIDTSTSSDICITIQNISELCNYRLRTAKLDFQIKRDLIVMNN